jgi:hypothetical protein
MADKKEIAISIWDTPEIGKPARIRGRVLVITGYGKEFFVHSEDACCYGLMPDDQRVRWCSYRDATPEEVATLEAAEKAKADAKAATKARKEEIASIGAKIRAEGEWPEKWQIPEGETLLDTMDVYGGGEAYIVGDAWIWHIRNNGMDGDDWSQNNIRTGGAGAIGWRIPYDADMAAVLRRLAKSG